MLVADLAEDSARDFLEGVALAGQTALVPLLAPPVDRGEHMLEVYSPASPEPLRLLADPVGPPTAAGFPLRLRFPRPQSTVRRAQERAPSLRARHPTSHELSERHTADLEGVEPAPFDASATLIGRSLAGGKLVIDSKIGGGGVGAVYRAMHRDLRIHVAVKVLHNTYREDPDFGRRFHAEALAASRLDHPNVTRVLDFGQEEDGLLYLVMEYLDGMGLRALLERDGRFGTERLVKIVSQVCAGLAHAHAKSIVHKDVKPENLVIVSGSDDDDGLTMEVVKVCDFGIAQGAVHEETRRFQGTPEYMSPEQCRADELDARSDVYAVGIVMYELVTGDVPFTDTEISHIVWRHINEIPELPSRRAQRSPHAGSERVDPRLERIIMKALSKKPEDRYASMRDLRAALRDLLEVAPVSLSGQFRRASMPSSAPRLTPQSMPSVSPPPSTPAPTSVARGEAEGWLITGSSALSDAPASGARISFAHDPASFLRKIVGTTDPRAFAELVLPLESALPELVASLQVEPLWRLASTLDLLASEGGPRAETAKRVLHTLRDPTTLAPIAQHVLSSGDPAGERLLVAAGAFGAHALYSARVRVESLAARARFVATLGAIGGASLPVLRSGLERLSDRLGAPNALQIAEDLLAAIPPVADEALGAIVSAYARSNVPALALAAVRVLPSLWQERSRPLVLGLLDHPDEAVALAAVGAILQLGIADAHTPRHIRGVLERALHPALRLAATRSLAEARGEARGIACEIVLELLRLLPPPATQEEAELGLALSAALFVLAVDRAAAEHALAGLTHYWPASVRARAFHRA